MSHIEEDVEMCVLKSVMVTHVASESHMSESCHMLILGICLILFAIVSHSNLRLIFSLPLAEVRL